MAVSAISWTLKGIKNWFTKWYHNEISIRLDLFFSKENTIPNFKEISVDMPYCTSCNRDSWHFRSLPHCFKKKKQGLKPLLCTVMTEKSK